MARILDIFAQHSSCKVLVVREEPSRGGEIQRAESTGKATSWYPDVIKPNNTVVQIGESLGKIWDPRDAHTFWMAHAAKVLTIEVEEFIEVTLNLVCLMEVL